MLLTEDMPAAFATDWTGMFVGHPSAVIRPADTAEVSAVLTVLNTHRIPLIAQGGNTGLVGGASAMSGEVVLSLCRLRSVGPVSAAGAVDVGAGVTLAELDSVDERFECGVRVASADSATVGGAVATNAGGSRVLRYGHMRAHVLGIEAVRADGSVLSHMSGLTKDNTGYGYASLLAGSEGTLAVITKVRVLLRPKLPPSTVVLAGITSADECFALAGAVRAAAGSSLVSAGFFTGFGLDVLVNRLDLAEPLPSRHVHYLLVEVLGDGSNLSDVFDTVDCVVGTSAKDKARLWEYRHRHPEVASFLGPPLKLDVSVPTQLWPDLIRDAIVAAHSVDEDAKLIRFGHILDGNVHMNIVPANADVPTNTFALFSAVANLGGSISAEHGEFGNLSVLWVGTPQRTFCRFTFTQFVPVCRAV